MLVAASSKSLAAIASLLSKSVVSAEEVNPRLYCIKTKELRRRQNVVRTLVTLSPAGFKFVRITF